MLPVPDPTSSFWAWLLILPVCVVGLFLPGHLLALRLRSPLPWVTAFIGSCLLLFAAALLIDVTGLPVQTLFLVGGVGLAGALVWVRRETPAGWRIDLRWQTVLREAWWMLPVIAAVVSTLLHAVVEPLSGFDTIFRWNHPALLWLEQGPLAHYPPTSAMDFRFYPWADGIPPLVPLVNLWIYWGTGSTNGALIAARLLVELLLTLGLVWHLACRLWGDHGGRMAVAVLATSTLFWWSIGMQQETGFSGIAWLSAAALFIEYRAKPDRATAIWLGLAVGFGALGRDYNLVLLPVLAVGMVWGRVPRGHFVGALGAAMVVVLPWLARNAWLTGNPLFPHDLGGWLATNPVHGIYLEAVRETFTYANPLLRETLLRGAAIGAGVLLLLGLPGLMLRRIEARVLLVLVLVATGLFLAAVPSTAGGAIYALRVLGPALPLLAVASGWWVTRLSGRACCVMGVALLPLSVDAARRSWNFAWTPDEAPWPYTWTTWSTIRSVVGQTAGSPIWGELARVAEPEATVVVNPDHFVRLGQRGGNPVSIFSPEVSALTDPAEIGLEEAVRALRKRGIRFVVLVDDHLHTSRFLRAMPVTRELLLLPPTVEVHGMRIYDLALIEETRADGD